MDWELLCVDEEIKIIFSSYGSGIDQRSGEIGSEAHGINILKLHPMNLWFPHGYDREVYQENRLAIIADVKAWQDENREAVLAYNLAYSRKHKRALYVKRASVRNADRNKFKADRRAYYQKHKEKILAYKNHWRAKQKAKQQQAAA